MCAMWFLNSALASFIIPRHGSHKVAPQVYLYYWYLFHCLILLCSYAFYLLALHLQQFHWRWLLLWHKQV